MSSSSEKSQLTPPLKWAGGKRWLVPRLLKLYASVKKPRLVEPFVGGLAVALGLEPERALLNDINPHLINFYHWLRRGLTAEIEMKNEREHFNAQRRRFNELISGAGAGTKEAAEIFYYLNRTCFNGLCRFNKSGEYNVPFGRYARLKYKHDFLEYHAALADWKFSCADFETLKLHHDDFLYADPPYDVEFTSYSKDGFSWEDQERLAFWLAKHPGPVVASNQATERILQLYRRLGFQVELLSAPRRISANGNREAASEMLAYKNI